MRTTSSVEAYNCVLNKNIVNGGNFFNFVHDLRAEEFIKREEMAAFIMSGSGTANKRREQYVVSVYLFFGQCVCVSVCAFLLFSLLQPCKHSKRNTQIRLFVYFRP